MLESYVLGTKTKLLIEPIFDLGLRSENIEFQKLPVAQNPSKMGTGKCFPNAFQLR